MPSEIRYDDEENDGLFAFDLDNLIAMRQAEHGPYRIDPLLYGRARIVYDNGNPKDWHGW